MPAWLAVLTAVLGFFSPAFAVYVAWRLKQIHVLVNSRLTEALDEIKRLGGHNEDF